MIGETSFNRNYQTIPRRFSGFQVRSIGYVPCKVAPVDMVFDTFNYSILLSGSGTQRIDGVDVELQFPCVLTQLPGEHTVYGPTAGGSWEELYFILPPEQYEPLAARGMIGENHRIWAVRNAPALIRSVRALFAAIERPGDSPGWIERIDHLAESVVKESLLPGDETSDPASEAVMGAAQMMTASPHRSYDFRAIAQDYGISFSTFQRRWRERYIDPPGQYLLSLRISECCRLLVESDLRIIEIGERLGFEDACYFSRIFSQRIGMPPTAYRTLHRTDG